MKCLELFNTIDRLNDKYVKVWEEVCNIESPTNCKESVDEVGDYFIKMAKERNWKIEVLECEAAGNAICITMNPESKKESVVFSGHIDTVHPKGLFGYPPVRFDEENIYGPGVTDCKGGVVASFMAMEALEECGFVDRPVKLIIQTDEETSSKTSNKRTIEFMCNHAKGAVAFLNTEYAVGNTAVLIRKGIVRHRLNIHGIATHSSRCTEGKSAIAEAAHKILKLETLKDDDGITCNCGVISGGTVANTVPAECSFITDIRFGDKAQYDKAMEFLKVVAETSYIGGCPCDLEEISYRPAMPLTDTNLKFLETMNKIYEENGLPRLEIKASRSGSDAAYITEIDVPCVDDVGVDGSHIHSVKEFARISSLAESAKKQAAVAFCI